MVPDERPFSWNQFWSGSHWRKRWEYANRAHLLVRAHLDPDLEPIDGPVDIEVRCYFRSQPMDADNICAKPYIDGLKGHYIHDDDHSHVRRVSCRTLHDSERPRIEIEIRRAGNADDR